MIKETKNFVVNVGGTVAAEKSDKQIQDLLDKQLNEIQKAQNSMIDELQKMTLKSKDIKAQLEAVMG